jgi:D-tyrosyl-tRNA(Tyr) deacylase
MRAVVQRVSQAQVTVDEVVVGRIDTGLCVLVGIGRDDGPSDADVMAEKVIGLRIFQDLDGKMNQSLLDVRGAVLAISQFTLFGDARKGRRPSFSEAMEPEQANRLFEHFCEQCRAKGALVQTGRFRSEMRVALVNEGPVTILLDTKKLF